MKNFKRILLSLAVAGAAFSSAGIASAELIPNAAADASNYMMKTGYEQQLQGSWMASNGDVTVGIIFMNNNINFVTITCHSFINRVINCFIN